MSIVRRIASNKQARMLKNAGSEEPAAVHEAKLQLVDAGAGTLPILFELLANDDARPHAKDVALELLSNDTLTEFVEALGTEPPPAVSALREILSQGKSYNPTRLLAFLAVPGSARKHVETVLTTRAKSIPAAELVAFLEEAPPDSRAVAYRLLEANANPSVVPELCKLVDHADWWYRKHGLQLLARFPSERTEEAASACLRDSNKHVRLQAVQTLHAVDAKSSVPALCGSLRDPDLKVHTAAIDALIALGDASAVQHLIEVLADESEYARRGAVEVLNEIATTEAVQDLVCALRDVDWWVRVRAADALGTLGGETVVNAILGLMDTEDVNVRRYAVEILNSVPNELAVDKLIGALDDPDWWVRERSIDALGVIGDPRATAPLAELMQVDAEAAVFCARSLGKLHDARAVDPLCQICEQRAGSDELQHEVREALQHLLKHELPPAELARVRAVLKNHQPRQDGGRMPLGVRGRAVHGDQTGQAGHAARRHAHPEDMLSMHGKPAEAQYDVARDTTGNTGERPRSLSMVGPVGATRPAEPAAPETPVPPPTPRPMDQSAAGVPAAMLTELPPDTVLLDRFRVMRKIGGGGFGSVYLVEDTTVDDQLILKILVPQISQDASMIQRFMQELKLTRRITHKNVIRLYDFLDLGNGHAISMEYFEGKDLGRVLDDGGPIPVGRGVSIAMQICEGLTAAHELGITHRDIKPPNILVGPDDSVKIVDFGLASSAQHVGSRVTKSGILIGTPQYMAPEQITGGDIDGRADIYSLGGVLYEMFSGMLAIGGDNAVNILFQHLEGEITPLKELAPHVPDELCELIMQALAKAPDERPATASAFLKSLELLTS